MPAFPFAHETWFDERRFPADWGFATETLTLALLAAAVLLTLAVRLIARAFPGVDVRWLARCAPFMPFAVRLHLAVSLIGLLSLGVYLSPAMDLEANALGIFLGAVMAVSAIGLATGYYARWAAALLITAGPLGIGEFGVWPVLQRIDLLGLALFVVIAGAGRWSADHELGRTADPSPEARAQAVWALKVCAGLALLLISGALPQAIVLIAGIPFNATLWFFGTSELVGHLPVYGAMLVLLVYGSDPEIRRAVSALWPFGRVWTAQPERRPKSTVIVAAGVNAGSPSGAPATMPAPTSS